MTGMVLGVKVVTKNTTRKMQNFDIGINQTEYALDVSKIHCMATKKHVQNVMLMDMKSICEAVKD